MIDSVEQDKLLKTINSLVGGYNGWERIDKFFKEDERIQSYYKEVRSKLIEDGCYSSAIIYTQTIERLLDEIDELKE